MTKSAQKAPVLGKSGLARSVAKRAGVSIETANKVITAIFGGKGVLMRRLKAGHTVVLPGFGKFHAVDKPWKWSRNPSTGESIRVGPRRQPHLKFSDVMRERVAEGHPDHGKPDPEARVVKPTRPGKAVPPQAAGKVPRKTNNGKLQAEALEDELTPDPDAVDEPTDAGDDIDPDDFEDEDSQDDGGDDEDEDSDDE